MEQICSHPVCQTLLLSSRNSQGTKARQVRSSNVSRWQHCPHPLESRPRVEEGGVNSVLGPQTHWERGGPADPDPGCPWPPSSPTPPTGHMATEPCWADPSSA